MRGRWKVVSVDRLPRALSKAKETATQYGVGDLVITELAEIKNTKVKSLEEDLDIEKTFDKDTYELTMCIRFGEKGFIPSLVNMVKEGGFLLFVHFADVGIKYSSPKDPRKLVKAKELTDYFEPRGFEILIDRVDPNFDGRFLNCFLARKTHNAPKKKRPETTPASVQTTDTTSTQAEESGTPRPSEEPKESTASVATQTTDFSKPSPLEAKVAETAKPSSPGKKANSARPSSSSKKKSETAKAPPNLPEGKTETEPAKPSTPPEERTEVAGAEEGGNPTVSEETSGGVRPLNPSKKKNEVAKPSTPTKSSVTAKPLTSPSKPTEPIPIPGKPNGAIPSSGPRKATPAEERLRKEFDIRLSDSEASL